MLDVQREELNGLGIRVNGIERCVVTHETKIEFLEKQATELKHDTWKAINTLREENKGTVFLMAKIVGGIMVVSFILSIVATVFIKLFIGG